MYFMSCGLAIKLMQQMQSSANEEAAEAEATENEEERQPVQHVNMNLADMWEKIKYEQIPLERWGYWLQSQMNGTR